MNGQYYSGGCLNGMKENFGYMIYANGSKYEGSWASDRREGKGTFVMADGSKYKGSWKHGLMHGTGKLLVYETGNKFSLGPQPKLYIGPFLNGLKHGSGMMIAHNGSVIDGMWREDVLISTSEPKKSTFDETQEALQQIESFKAEDSHLSLTNKVSERSQSISLPIIHNIPKPREQQEFTGSSHL